MMKAEGNTRRNINKAMVSGFASSQLEEFMRNNPPREEAEEFFKEWVERHGSELAWSHSTYKTLASPDVNVETMETYFQVLEEANCATAVIEIGTRKRYINGRLCPSKLQCFLSFFSTATLAYDCVWSLLEGHVTYYGADKSLWDSHDQES